MRREREATVTRRAATVVLVAGLTLAACGGSGSVPESPRAERTATKYHCPMHPTVVSDRPGDCPICNMRLVPIEPEEDAGGAASPPGETVSDRAAVRIAPRRLQQIGVETGVVERAPFVKTIHAVGRVTVDETRLLHMHTKVAGYLEVLRANATGELLRAGQPVAELYSPELVSAQEEYLVALRARERTADSTIPGVAASGDGLVEAARARLRYYDMTADEITRLERAGKALRTITLYAPATGVVLRREVTEGERVEVGTTLLDIADLSRVWVIASVYEMDLPFVKSGQKATMRLPYDPGTSLEGRVALIYPVLDAPTRTAQVRLEFPNPNGALKPDMYAEVELHADLGTRLSVPDEAVLESGERAIVFVETGDGAFDPREVRLGLRLSDRSEILSGLEEGERILTSGQFYVDSESKLKAALAAAGRDAAPTGHAHADGR